MAPHAKRRRNKYSYSAKQPVACTHGSPMLPSYFVAVLLFKKARLPGGLTTKEEVAVHWYAKKREGEVMKTPPQRRNFGIAMHFLLVHDVPCSNAWRDHRLCLLPIFDSLCRCTQPAKKCAINDSTINFPFSISQKIGRKESGFLWRPTLHFKPKLFFCCSSTLWGQLTHPCNGGYGGRDPETGTFL